MCAEGSAEERGRVTENGGQVLGERPLLHSCMVGGGEGWVCSETWCGWWGSVRRPVGGRREVLGGVGVRWSMGMGGRGGGLVLRGVVGLGVWRLEECGGLGLCYG